MLPGLLFAIWRSFEIFTLLPIVGMLSWFVHGYTTQSELTPTFILVLFIVSVIALVWAIATVLAYGATKYNGRFVAFVDLLIIGGLIAGVYELRHITNDNCAHFGQGSTNSLYFSLGIFGSGGVQAGLPWALHLDKNCSMLKASFALAIMNILFFAVTFLLALWIAHHHRGEIGHSSRTVRRESYRSHHSSRSPRRSHHSHHSSRRTYI